MKALDKLREFTDKFLLIILIVSGLALGSSAVFYALNCLLRYAFKAPLAWPEEYCTYVIVLMVFLMQCRLEFRDESLSISVIWEKVKEKPIARRILYSFKGIVTIAMAALMTDIGFSLVEQQFTYGAVTPVMRIPFGIYYIAISISFALVAIVWVINLFTKQFDEEGKEDINA